MLPLVGSGLIHNHLFLPARLRYGGNLTKKPLTFNCGLTNLCEAKTALACAWFMWLGSLALLFQSLLSTVWHYLVSSIVMTTSLFTLFSPLRGTKRLTASIETARTVEASQTTRIKIFLHHSLNLNLNTRWLTLEVSHEASTIISRTFLDTNILRKVSFRISKKFH